MRFETQQVGLEQPILGMKCFHDMGTIRVIVESKFWAGLTENQPVTYIRQRPTGVGALVLLVFPATRLQIVCDEAVARFWRDDISVHDVQELRTVIAAGTGEGHFFAATSWSVLPEDLSVAATSAGESESYGDIAQLVGSVERLNFDGGLCGNPERIGGLARDASTIVPVRGLTSRLGNLLRTSGFPRRCGARRSLG